MGRGRGERQARGRRDRGNVREPRGQRDRRPGQVRRRGVLNRVVEPDGIGNVGVDQSELRGLRVHQRDKARAWHGRLGQRDSGIISRVQKESVEQLADGQALTRPQPHARRIPGKLIDRRRNGHDLVEPQVLERDQGGHDLQQAGRGVPAVRIELVQHPAGIEIQENGRPSLEAGRGRRRPNQLVDLDRLRR